VLFPVIVNGVWWERWRYDNLAHMKFFLLITATLFLASCAPKEVDRTATPRPQAREFSVTISDFQYTPPQIDVRLGDRVVLHITNQDNTAHAINLSEFGIQTSVGPGQTQTVEFTANQQVPPKPLCAHGETLFINVQS